MTKRLNWKKYITIALDVILAIYILLAFTALNKPNLTMRACTKVNINIQDETTGGFIKANDIKNRLKNKNLYPLEKTMNSISTRTIEQTLRQSPFVKTAECYKTQDGQINLTITQRMPILRIKANNGDDYYLDDNYQIMPNSTYTSDLIIATGYINKWFAKKYISVLTAEIMQNELWKNQIVQINVTKQHGIELVPRVGQHIIYLGQIPQHYSYKQRIQIIKQFVDTKLKRLEKFYKYGLSKAGWNKYSYINLEFDNQIICRKNNNIHSID